MLERCIGASDFSLVRYGGFDASGVDQSGTTTTLGSYWQTEAGTTIPTLTSTTPFGTTGRVVANISSQKYIKQRIYEIPQSELNTYIYDPTMFRTNAKYTYTVSGYAKAEDAVYSENANFRIRIDVLYYQKSTSSNVTKSYYFDFLPSCEGWQFTGGTFSTAYERESSSDTNAYSCVTAIDVICEYSYQPAGYALFDNISVTNTGGKNTEKYYYYSEGTANGLLAKTESLFYIEYYEYDENRNLSRVANNRGEFTDYTYTSTNKVNYTVEYEFLHQGSYDYPAYLDDPDSAITKTPKFKTRYVYDAFGLCYITESYELDSSGNKASDAKSLYQRYIYDTSAGSKKFGAVTREYDGTGKDVYYYYDETNGRLLASASGSMGICYTYDEMGNLVGVMPAMQGVSSSYTPETNKEEVTYTYNERNLLSTISTDSTTYTFTYDVFGNTSSVKTGANEITGAVSGDVTGAISHRVLTGSWDGADDAILNGMVDGALSGAIIGAITGGIEGGLGHFSTSRALKSSQVDPRIADALKKLDMTGIRPGQTQISQKAVFDVVTNILWTTLKIVP